MDSQKDLELAVRLLEHYKVLEKIGHCSEQELNIIASNIKVPVNDLHDFANKFAQHSFLKERKERRSNNIKAHHQIILTDAREQPIVSQAKHNGTSLEPLASKYDQFFTRGYKVIFRIRSEELAEACSKVLHQDILSCDDPLPSINHGDIFLLLKEERREKNHCGNFPLVQQFTYRSEL